MRTSSLDRAAPSASSRRKLAPLCSDGGDFAWQLGTRESPALRDVSAAAASTALAGLLEAQEENAKDVVGRHLAAARGFALLDRLESLRIDILEGQLSPHRLLALASAVRQQRTLTDDEHLDTVLAEIDTETLDNY